MATKRTKKTETSPIERYLDLALENQAAFEKEMDGVRKRTAKMTNLLSEQLRESQRGALSLTKEIAGHPTDFAANSKAMMDAAMEAQTRALDFAKDLYKEQMDAARAARNSMEKLVESSREAAGVATEFGEWFTAQNPMADAWEKGMAAFRN